MKNCKKLNCFFIYYRLVTLSPNQPTKQANRMSYNSIDQTLSLMIPRVFPKWTDEQKIIDVFHQQQLGRVYKVSIIRQPDSKKRNYPIYQAFVYFSSWYENAIAYHFQQRILGEKAQARVVYDDPWYWVAFENTNRRLSNNDKRIMRVGYQTYVAEQYMLEQDDRIRRLENIISERLPTPDRAPMPQRPVPVPAELVPAELVVPMKSEPHLIWQNLSEKFAMDMLGDELQLTETAMNVAEAALLEPAVLEPAVLDEAALLEPAVLEPAVLEPAALLDTYNSDNVISREWTQCGGSLWIQTQLTDAAAEMLGDELQLTETAIDVAERALTELAPLEYNYDEGLEDYYPTKEEYDHEDVEDYYPPEEEFYRGGNQWEDDDYDY